MAEAWGGILKGLGTALTSIYQVVPSYGVAIVLLTLGIRVLLIPLTIKQIRSMTAMQQIQPEVKRLQAKHKGDRQKLNEEMMKLYKERGVNPFGGCFPLLMQAPVFIALYSVLRAVIPADAVLPPGTAVDLPPAKSICTPTTPASAHGPGPTEIVCRAENGDETRYAVAGLPDGNGKATQIPPFVRLCRPLPQAQDPKKLAGFRCASTVGTGHLSRNSKLLADIVEDRTVFLGMELACSPTQAGSKSAIRACAPAGRKAGGAPLAGYYFLIALMVGTTYYQQKQVSVQQAGSPQADQAKIMRTIMPVFLGFISLNIPAGVILYWIVSNGWTIGQQTLVLRKQSALSSGTGDPKTARKRGRGGKA